MRILTRALMLASVTVCLACGASGQSDVSAPTTPSAPNAGTITNGSVTLAYEIDLPSGSPPFPAIVAGHGSGIVTRQDLRFFSQQWTSRGFAVLRFDKRGTGQSTGTYSGMSVTNSEALVATLASDIAAAVRLLRTRPEIDSRQIGLSGGSQAGWILPAAARMLGDVPFMVLLAGPVCSVGEEIFYSDLAENTTRPLDDVYPAMAEFKGPHGFDPSPVLQDINTATFWVLGLDDRSIPVRTSVERLTAFAAGGRPFQWRTYPGLGHSLWPAVWSDIDEWVRRFRE